MKGDEESYSASMEGSTFQCNYGYWKRSTKDDTESLSEEQIRSTEKRNVANKNRKYWLFCC